MINKIEEMLNSKLTTPKTIYVLKGFNSIIDRLKISIKHVFDLELTKTLENLNNCTNTLLTSGLSNLNEEVPLYCLYEEMLMVERNNIFGIIQAKNYSVCVMDIGIFDVYYPGFLNQNNDSIIEKFEIDSVDSNYLQQVYSNCINENGNLVISYNEIDPNIVSSYIKLYVSHSTNLFHYNVSDTHCIDLFDNTNSQQLVDTFNKIADKTYNAISYSTIENRDSSIVFKFISILNSFGIDVILKKVDKEIPLPELYDEYLEILHRKNKSYNFLDIEMYQDPFNSNKIVPLNQSIIIDSIYQNILKSKNGDYPRDIFVTAPTGAGKSILFQIPAIMAAEKENLVTIVISPLIGLMNDQVENIKSMTNVAATINSDYTPFEKEKIKDNIKNGQTSILYVSPETLLSNSDITTFIGDRQIGLLVVDEAHTVATWGKNFRPDYWYLGDYLNKLRHNTKHVFPIATFTATATIGNGNDDMYHDIIDSLNMTSPISFIGNVKRKNIDFDIRVCHKDHAYAEEKDYKVISSINNYLDKNEKTLIYFPYVSKLNDIYNHLDTNKVRKYYGGLDKTNKNETLDNIRIGASNIVLATKAFGMGIDVPDIKNVYHFAPTGNLADYVQEIGRAARKPELHGIASTDFYREDFRYINKLYGMSQITIYNIIGVLQKIIYKYRQCKKRNFLVSTEEFAHVFIAKDDSEIESKLKATILAIKKDFVRTTSYVPLIFKPRSMFTKGLFYIPDNKMEYIQSIGWNKYLNKKYDRKDLSKMETGGTSYSYFGDVYEFDFKKCWEEKYNGLYNGISFGSFKKQFFTTDDKGINELGINKNAFLDRMILNVNAKYGENFENVCNKAYVILDKIKDSLDDIKISGKHFSIDELAQKVSNKLQNGISSRKLSNILDPFINILINVDRNVTFGNAKFCEYNSQTNKYHIVSSYYGKMIYDIKNEIKLYFADSLFENERVSIVDSSKDTNKKMRKNLLLVTVQILELFDLITYSLKNGDRPEFFIRVNSEKAILKVLENKNYHSQTLDSIRDLHFSSVDFMTHFFEKLSTNEERWSFIEDYFLGTDLYSKYNVEKIEKTKVKIIDDAREDEKFKPKNLPKESIKIYTIGGDVEGKFYIANEELSLSYPATRLSPDCEVAKLLTINNIGDVFKVNTYEYIIEDIELHEI